MSTIRKALAVLTLAALACLLARVAGASDRCCAQCGHAGRVKRICRPVCATKEVTVTCWDCVCEDFCVPGCRQGRGGCCPTACAHVYTRKKLMKREVVKEVPVIEWVVEYVCCECSKGGAEAAPHEARSDPPTATSNPKRAPRAVSQPLVMKPAQPDRLRVDR